MNSKKSEILSCKKLQPRPEKAVTKRCKMKKGAAKVCAGMLLITLKILIMMTQATKHWFNVL